MLPCFPTALQFNLLTHTLWSFLLPVFFLPYNHSLWQPFHFLLLPVAGVSGPKWNWVFGSFVKWSELLVFSSCHKYKPFSLFHSCVFFFLLSSGCCCCCYIFGLLFVWFSFGFPQFSFYGLGNEHEMLFQVSFVCYSGEPLQCEAADRPAIHTFGLKISIHKTKPNYQNKNFQK